MSDTVVDAQNHLDLTTTQADDFGRQEVSLPVEEPSQNTQPNPDTSHESPRGDSPKKSVTLERQESQGNTPKLYKLDSISDERIDINEIPEKVDKTKYEPTSEVIIEEVAKEEEGVEKKEEKPEEPKPPVQLELAKRIEMANELKNKAAPFVKKGEYSEAIKLYEESFFVLRPSAEDRGDQNFVKSLQLQNAIFNNLSLCYANLGRYRESISYASRVLYIDKHNVKALFRVATGLHKLGDNLKAYNIIKECIAAHKNQFPGENLDSEIHKFYLQLKELCKEHLEEEKQKQKEVFAKMFNQEKPAASPAKKNIKADASKDLLLNRPVLYGLCSVPSLLMGLVVSEVLKDKGTASLERSVAGALSGAGLFTGMVLSKNSVARSLLGLVPLGAFVAFQILKKK